MSLGNWTIRLQAFRDLVTPLIFKDEAGTPLDLNGWTVKIVVTHDGGELTWSTATGHFVIASPTTLGKATLTVPKAEIAAAAALFKWAGFELFAGADANNLDLIYSGKVRTE